jgi:hypothetical protein
MRELSEKEIDAAVVELVAHMREQLRRAEMDTSPEAVREACRRRLRSRIALQALRERPELVAAGHE